ncbi:MAG: peptide ABC transporter substrate-binding protein [Thermoanaerobaculia bacterium]
MTREIPEADWKAWRALREEALQDFCQKILDEAAGFAEGEGTPHERYLQLYRRIQERNDELAEVFDNPRRSVAYVQIAAAVRRGAVRESEIARFSEETQRILALMRGE